MSELESTTSYELFKIWTRKKSQGARPGEYGGCCMTVTFSDFQNCFTIYVMVHYHEVDLLTYLVLVAPRGTWGKDYGLPFFSVNGFRFHLSPGKVHVFEFLFNSSPPCCHSTAFHPFTFCGPSWCHSCYVICWFS